MNGEIYKCDDCGDRFFKFTMYSFDAWNFDHIIQPEGEYMLCKGCIIRALYKYIHEKVLNMKELVG